MRRIKITLLFLSLVFVNGCGQNVGGVQRQPLPSSTIPVVNHIQSCWFGYADNLNRLQDEYEECMDDENDYTTCVENRDVSEGVAVESLYDCFIQLPMVDYSCIEQLQPDNCDHDTDGDGVEDCWEYKMYLNPCEPCSYGGTPGVDCDGDLDFDRDPANNADDDFPICGQIYINGQWYPNPEGINDGRCV